MKRFRSNRSLKNATDRRLSIESLENRCLLAVIDGWVWNDANHDGHRANSSTEYRIAEVRVNLLHADKTVAATTETDREGRYQFFEVSAGDYMLEFVPPDDVIFTPPDNSSENKDSDVSPDSGLTDIFSVQEQQHVDDIDAGVFSRFGTQSIKGRVWNDINGNGIREPEEPGLSGQKVKLENRLFKKLLEVETDRSGNFRFEGTRLIPGEYIVDFKRPDDGDPWRFSPQFNQEVEPGFDSDADLENGKTQSFHLQTASRDVTPNDIQLDAGFFQSAQIIGRVWHDADGDGIQNDTVGNRLNDGVESIVVQILDEDLNEIGNTVTNGYGIFRFPVSPGRYTLRFESPPGVSFTRSHQGDDFLDSDVDPQNGLSDTFIVSGTQDITNVSAGLVSQSSPSSIHGRVWHDLNANGIQEPGEPGISRSHVLLENESRKGVLFATSDDSGRYQIDGSNLLPGTHVVAIPAPQDGRAWHISSRNIDQLDSRLDNDLQPTNAKTPPFELEAGLGRPSIVFRDGGFFRHGRILGGVWDDANQDGSRGEDETLVAGVHVSLLDASGRLLERTRTNASGIYRFNDVVPGRQYSVQVSRPDGTQFSPQQPGADNSISAINPDTHRSELFTFESGKTVRRYAGIFGESNSTGIKGTVWDDFNGNGIQDADEQGLAGVLVHANNGQREITSVRTNAEGEYHFEHLSAGNYSLEIKLPSNVTFSPINQHENDSIDSDVNRSTGRTRAYPIITNQTESSIDVGVYRGPLSKNVRDSIRVTEVAFIGHGNAEFIELKNIGEHPVDMRGVKFTDGIIFDFTRSSITSLFPGEHTIVIGRNETVADRHPIEQINIAGIYEDDIGREERMTVVDKDGEVVTNFRYDDDWFIIMDDEYLPWSLSILDEQADESLWSSRANWRPSSFQGGTPGYDDPRLTPDPNSVVINEVLTKSSDGFNDLIELHNTTDTAIDISNWYLGDYTPRDQDDPETFLTRYRIAPGTIIGPGEFLVYSRESHFASETDPGLNSRFGLSSFGESVHLVAADEFGNILGYSDSFSFPATDIDVSFGRTPIKDGSSVVTVMSTPTFGRTNSHPQIGPIVIDQIMFDTTADEYIRLHNVSSERVSLSSELGSWSLRGAVEYDFERNENDATIDAGEYAIVASTSPTIFRERFGIPSEIKIFGPFSGNLDNDGEELSLFRPGPSSFRDNAWLQRQILVDRVPYDDKLPWPIESTVGDVALMRLSNDWIGEDPANWTHSRHLVGTHFGNGRFLRQFAATDSHRLFDHDPIGRVITKTVVGDATGDGVFNSQDLVAIFSAGKYLNGPAAWTEGDWNGDNIFDQQDLVLVFQAGGYIDAAAVLDDPDDDRG